MTNYVKNADLTHSDKIAIISNELGLGELLTQLAEEASELSKAALKYRRTITPGASPTPMDPQEALDNLAEELIDVDICASCVEKAMPSEDARAMRRACGDYYDYKLNRWDDRIRRRMNHEGKAFGNARRD